MKLIWKIDRDHILRYKGGKSRPSYMTEGRPKDHYYFDFTLNGALIKDCDILTKRHDTYIAFRLKDKRYVKVIEHTYYGPILTVDGKVLLPINRGYQRKCPQCKKKNDLSKEHCLSCGATLPSAMEIIRKRYILTIFALSFIIITGIGLAYMYGQSYLKANPPPSIETKLKQSSLKIITA